MKLFWGFFGLDLEFEENQMPSVEGCHSPVHKAQYTGKWWRRKDERKGGGVWVVKVEAGDRKGAVFHSPTRVLSVKTSRTCLSALHSTVSEPLFDGRLAKHNTSPVLRRGQVSSEEDLGL